MKKFLFGCAVAVSAFQPISAQNLCCPPPCDPCFDSDFNGFYVGGNIGAITHTAQRIDLDVFFDDSSSWTTIDTSFSAGVQLGHDWQFCNALIGIVGDWSWANTRHRLRNDPNDPEDPTDNEIRSDCHWFSTIRARAGLTVCDALVYITAGGAAGHFHNRWIVDPDEFIDRDTRWGWVIGAGTEFLLGCSWSIGLEVLWLNFDDHKRTFSALDGTMFDFNHSDSAWIGRVTFNYRFGNLCCF